MEIYFRPIMNSNDNLSSVQKTGVVYLKSNSEQQGAVVWVKRDFDAGFDIRVSEYGHGQFSILRNKSSLYLLEELSAMGHTITDENDFNNAFIDAASWILYNTPNNKEKIDPMPKPKRRRSVAKDKQKENSM